MSDMTYYYDGESDDEELDPNRLRRIKAKIYANPNSSHALVLVFQVLSCISVMWLICNILLRMFFFCHQLQ